MLESTPDVLPSVDLIHVQRYIPSVRNSFRTLNKQTKNPLFIHLSFSSNHRQTLISLLVDLEFCHFQIVQQLQTGDIHLVTSICVSFMTNFSIQFIMYAMLIIVSLCSQTRQWKFGSSCLHLSSVGIIGMPYHVLFVGRWGQNSVIQACQKRTPPSELHLQPCSPCPFMAWWDDLFPFIHRWYSITWTSRNLPSLLATEDLDVSEF